jgi:hypothetical protein
MNTLSAAASSAAAYAYILLYICTYIMLCFIYTLCYCVHRSILCTRKLTKRFCQDPKISNLITQMRSITLHETSCIYTHFRK